MASFAKIGLNNKVIEVLAVNNNELKDSNGVEQEVNGIDFLTKLTGYPLWKQTSYNTHGGVHSDGKFAIHKNYAGIVYLFDGVGFYAPQPYPSWTKDEATYLWEAPTPMPVVEGKMYQWVEDDLNWQEIVLPE